VDISLSLIIISPKLMG